MAPETGPQLWQSSFLDTLSVSESHSHTNNWSTRKIKIFLLILFLYDRNEVKSIPGWYFLWKTAREVIAVSQTEENERMRTTRDLRERERERAVAGTVSSQLLLGWQSRLGTGTKDTEFGLSGLCVAVADILFQLRRIGYIRKSDNNSRIFLGCWLYKLPLKQRRSRQ